MDWIKKNVSLLVSAVVAFCLIGLAGFYLYGQINKNSQVSTRLASEKARYDKLARQSPGLGSGDGVDNLDMASRQLLRLSASEAKLSRLYQAPETVEPDEQVFKLELGAVIRNIRAEGEKIGLTVSNDFQLGFTAQSKSYLFASNSLDQLVLQLADLTEISEILLDARVNSIEQVRRVKVSADDSGPEAVASEYLPEDYVVMTNETTGAVLYPYEVTVRVFSDGLGRLLKGFAESQYPLVLKTVEIEQAEARALEIPGLVTAPAPTSGRYGAAAPNSRSSAASQGGAGRYGDNRRTSRGAAGGGDRYGGAGRQRPTATPSTGVATSQAELNRFLQRQGLGGNTPTTPTEPVVAFSESPLEVVLGIEVIHFPASETTETASQ